MPRGNFSVRAVAEQVAFGRDQATLWRMSVDWACVNCWTLSHTHTYIYVHTHSCRLPFYLRHTQLQKPTSRQTWKTVGCSQSGGTVGSLCSLCNKALLLWCSPVSSYSTCIFSCLSSCSQSLLDVCVWSHRALTFFFFNVLHLVLTFSNWNDTVVRKKVVSYGSCAEGKS